MDTYWLMDKSYNSGKGADEWDDCRIPGQTSSHAEPFSSPDLITSQISPGRRLVYMSKQVQDVKVSHSQGRSSSSPTEILTDKDGGETMK